MERTLSIIRGAFILLLVLAGGGWFVWRSIKRSDDPARALFRWSVTVVVLIVGGFAVGRLLSADDTVAQLIGLMLALIIGLMLAIVWVPHMASTVGDWFGNLYSGGNAPPDPTPFYSIAHAMRKKGQPAAALQEIHKQLQRFPTDVTGHLLLAEIQAEDFKDLAAAQLTLEAFCAQPGHPPAHVAEAFNRLADWQMKLANDPEAARLALQRIIDLLPGTPQAQIAAQRLAHFGDDGALQAVRERKPIHLPQGVQNIGLLKDSSALGTPKEDFEAAAAQLVAHLEQHPLDTEAREKLAMIYSDHYQRLDLAADQLHQLADSPHQPPHAVARWLNLLADMQIKHGATYESVRETLQKIVERFPGFAPAELAQQRLEHLRLELKGRESPQVVKLGTYEQNIGLKGKTPPKR